MPECGNCGSHVTTRYERVHKPDEVEQVRTCPNCDLVRETGTNVREAVHVATGHSEIADNEAAPDWSEARNSRGEKRVATDGGDGDE